MSLPLKKEYNEKLRDSFLNALLLGSFAPLDELNKRLKIEKNSFKIKPTPIMNGLEESMSNRGEDLRDASCIIKDARRKDLETALIPIENERHQRNPHRDNHLKLIKLTRDTINKLKKDPDLWCDRRAYTPKNNAKYIGYFSLSGAFLLVTAMLGVDFFVQTATPALPHQ